MPRQIPLTLFSSTETSSASDETNDAHLEQLKTDCFAVLRHFHFAGVTGIREVVEGLSVTRYILETDCGKVSFRSIVSKDRELATAFGVDTVTINSDKTGFYIDIPCNQRKTLPHGDMVRHAQSRYQSGSARERCNVAIGMTPTGEVVEFNIFEAPHAIIAGSTGAGKSVCINTILTSMLSQLSPDEVQFVLIDPKRVELTKYNGIPHLWMKPVITDINEAIETLRIVEDEMRSRNTLFEKNGVKKLDEYNALPSAKKLPYLVVVIDELADLMDAGSRIKVRGEGNRVELYIDSIARLARAAGIHLMLATQRPSADVITGTIKNNVPERIAFRVTTGIDSKVVLDQVGAEKLLGKGDGYYKSSSGKLARFQNSFVNDAEIDAVVSWCHTNDAPLDIIIVPPVEAPIPIEEQEIVVGDIDIKTLLAPTPPVTMTQPPLPLVVAEQSLSTAIVQFEDPNLEAAVSEALGLAVGRVITTNALEKLTALRANNIGITSLRGLEHCRNLERLNLSQNNISSVGELIKLEKLQSLELGHNKIESVLVLSHIKTLMSLGLRDNCITDVTSLCELKNLVGLHLSGNPANFNVLKPIYENLKRKDFKLNDVFEENAPLRFACPYFEEAILKELGKNGPVYPLDLAKISQLIIGNPECMSLVGLEYCKNLTILLVAGDSNSMVNASLDGTALIGGLKYLECLHLTDKNIEDIEFLSSLPNLLELSLAGNNITNVDVLQKQTRLRVLYLGGNPIASFEPTRAYYDTLRKKDFLLDTEILKDFEEMPEKVPQKPSFWHTAKQSIFAIFEPLTSPSVPTYETEQVTRKAHLRKVGDKQVKVSAATVSVRKRAPIVPENVNIKVRSNRR